MRQHLFFWQFFNIDGKSLENIDGYKELFTHWTFFWSRIIRIYLLNSCPQTFTDNIYGLSLTWIVFNKIENSFAKKYQRSTIILFLWILKGVLLIFYAFFYLWIYWLSFIIAKQDLLWDTWNTIFLQNLFCVVICKIFI